MKRVVRVYVWVWVAVIATAIGAIALVPSHHDLAENPYAVEKIVKVDLPDIAHVESVNNLGRGTSRWDVYMHRAQFSEPLSEASIKVLDALCLTDSVHWSKNGPERYYVYNDEGGIDDLYSVSCVIRDTRFVLTYYVDEVEGIFVLLLLLLVCSLLLVWGIVLAVHEKSE